MNEKLLLAWWRNKTIITRPNIIKLVFPLQENNKGNINFIRS